MFGVHEKANLLHPPAVRTARGGKKRVPTLSQREGAQLPVDPSNVRRRWRPRLRAFPGRAEERGRDAARPAAAMLGPWRAMQDGLEATGGWRCRWRTRTACEGRARRRTRRWAPALGSSWAVLCVALARWSRRRSRVVVGPVSLAPAARRRPEVEAVCGVWRRARRRTDGPGRHRRRARS